MFDDFIFDNFEEEEKDALLNNNKSESVVEIPAEAVVEPVTLDKLTDEQEQKLFTVLGKGINKILHDLCSIDDDDIPF